MSKPIRKPKLALESVSVNSITQSFKASWNVSQLKLRKSYPQTSRQKVFHKLILEKETKMIFLDGCSGAAKTYLSIYGGLELLKSREIDKIVYIRSAVESSSKSLGSLPGEIDDKFAPYSMPLQEKIEEIAVGGRSDYNHLKYSESLLAMPVNYTRGLTFKSSLVIIDEAQNMTESELTTLITRFGENSKYVVIGDSNQADIPNSGFETIMSKFVGIDCENKGIYTIKFSYEDVVRSKILKFIVSKLDS